MREDWRKCIEIGPPAVEQLIIALKPYKDCEYGQYKYWDVSPKAYALGEIGDKRAVEPLMAALKSDEGEVAIALAKLADKKAIPALVEALYYWTSKDEVIFALEKFGWRPKSIEEKVHRLVAKSDWHTLRKEWNETKPVLLNDLQSGDPIKYTYAANSLIRVGMEEIVEKLIEKLNKSGTKTMAESFLNSGHTSLSEPIRHTYV